MGDQLRAREVERQRFDGWVSEGIVTRGVTGWEPAIVLARARRAQQYSKACSKTANVWLRPPNWTKSRTFTLRFRLAMLVALPEQELPTSAASCRAPRWKLFHERVGLSIDGLPVRPIIRAVANHTQERKPMGGIRPGVKAAVGIERKMTVGAI